MNTKIKIFLKIYKKSLIANRQGNHKLEDTLMSILYGQWNCMSDDERTALDYIIKHRASKAKNLSL